LGKEPASVEGLFGYDRYGFAITDNAGTAVTVETGGAPTV